MSIPFKGVINVDIRDSEPDWTPFEPPRAPEGAASVLYIVLDDVGFFGDERLRRPDRDAEHRPDRREARRRAARGSSPQADEPPVERASQLSLRDDAAAEALDLGRGER